MIPPAPDYTNPANRPPYFTDVILRENTRILMPCQYEAMRQVMIGPDSKRVLDEAVAEHNWKKADRIQRYQILCDAMMMTGLRYVEFGHMERSWYYGPRRVLQVPKGAHGKQRSLFQERTVMLSL